MGHGALAKQGIESVGGWGRNLYPHTPSSSSSPSSPSSPTPHTVNTISNPQLMAERLESLKAGIIGGFSLFFGFAIASLFNTLLLAKYFKILVSLQTDFNWYLWMSAAVATFTGFLFGVTYRYIIRSDKNLQLKSGGVLAFGLVRGLTQIELGWSYNTTIWPLLVMAAESVLWFAIAANALDIAMQLNWVKPFSST
ncbi:MAG: hypothetical protein RMY29_004635 [Nostoc sp. CreGUA01]|nr:hypothetical protein [Nostoc sp. CreGUA01]